MRKRLTVLLTLAFCYSIASSQSTVQNEWKINVSDSLEYDSGFLDYWKHIKPYPITITNDSIIINNEYSNPVIIPTDLEKNNHILYSCELNDTLFRLTVTRINYTNLEYEIKGVARNNLVFSRCGIAVLDPSFYLGSEGVVLINDDIAFGMNEYNIKLNDEEVIKLLVPVGTTEGIDYIENKIYLSFKKMDQK